MNYLVMRLMSSFLCGALLSKTGSVLQLFTRNQLSSPSTLGIDGLAVLWVLVLYSLSIFIGLEFSSLQIFLLGIPFFVSIGIIFSKGFKGKIKYERVILLGLTFNLFVGALFSLWQFLFLAFNYPFPTELWFGQFKFVDSNAVWTLLNLEVLFIFIIFSFRHRLRLFSLGESLAFNFSLEKSLFIKVLLVMSTVSVLGVVCFFGAFSFLGLIFPILARSLWFKKMDIEGEFIFGSIFNGILLMLIDLVCYLLPVMGAEIPVGLVASSFGALSLIFLLWKSFKRERLAKTEI